MQPKAPKQPKWHLVYFILAAFDLVTVSASLYLNHRIMNIYTDSVAVNQEWATRLGSYSDLGQLAGAVNAPGNDVFDSHDVAGESRRMQEARTLFDSKVAEVRADLEQHGDKGELIPLLKSLDAVIEAMNAMGEEANLIFSYFSQNLPEKAGSRMATMDRKYGEVNAAFALLNGHVRELQRKQFEQQITTASSLRQFEYVIAAFIVLMVGGVTFYGHRIAQEIAKITHEREQHVEVLRESEQRLRNELTHNQHQQTQEITEGVSILTNTFGQITTSLTQLLASSSQTATAISETATTVEEVKQTAIIVSQKAQAVAEATRTTTQVAQAGEQAVAQARGGLSQIQMQMTSIAEQVIQLDQKSQAISDIIATVKDLAEQSNLLAVNAAIEAAKAGEQGKGFSVVAQEVRMLAEQSKQATVQVRSILQEIQKAAQAAVTVTEQGSKAVESGLHQSLEADASIQALTRSMLDAAQAVQHIAAASAQQLVGMEHVAVAMSSVKQSTGQNLDGVRQIESAAHNLQNVGQTLSQLVTQLQDKEFDHLPATDAAPVG